MGREWRSRPSGGSPAEATSRCYGCNSGVISSARMERRRQIPILERSLNKTRPDVSLSAFAFLFAETVNYCLKKVTMVHELEDRLHDLGMPVGVRVLDLYNFKFNNNRREVRLLAML